MLFGTEPFSSMLRLSNLGWYRYDWVWNKQKAANFLFGNKQPMKITEAISVFYQHQPTYNPEKSTRPFGVSRNGGNSVSGRVAEHFGGSQPAEWKSSKTWEPDKLLPTNILNFKKPVHPTHPTQKPVDLLAYFIRTYTQPGELVLDNAAGSCTTAVACIRTGRRCICIEKEKKYCDIGEMRIRKEQEQQTMLST